MSKKKKNNKKRNNKTTSFNVPTICGGNIVGKMTSDGKLSGSIIFPEDDGPTLEEFMKQASKATDDVLLQTIINSK